MYQFDSTRPISLRLNTPSGVKTVKTRFPSDDEWDQRQRLRKVIVKQLGRGSSETTMPQGPEVDLAMLEKTKLDGSDEVDAHEASRLVEQLSLCDVDDVVQDGALYNVSMRVLGGTVTIALRMPSAKEVADYRRSAVRVLDQPFNKQQITVNLKASGDLFQKIFSHSDSYIGSVPLPHQAAAAKAVVEALDSSFQEDSEANFN